MNLSLENVLSIFSAIGFGGILGAYLQYRLQRQKELQEDIHRLKRERYGAILIQMLTVLSPEHLPKTQRFRPDLKNVDDFKEEVRIEMLNSVLFASDDVIKAMGEFVKNPDYRAYIRTVSAMRKDLWNRKTKIGEDMLNAFVNPPGKNREGTRHEL